MQQILNLDAIACWLTLVLCVELLTMYKKNVTCVIIIVDKFADEGWKTWHLMGYGFVGLLFIFVCLVLSMVVKCLLLEGLKEQHDSTSIACSLVHN
jgi:hypothetical protein